MLGKTEFKAVPRVRGDGKHCDLCGCSFPAVRCDKCNSQIFCLSCDDMYHRHPKRRYHLRKAVDPTPTPQARPVLPIKISQLTAAPGDPSKMPLPPPRKKKTGKSFFDAFRRSSPSSENSPPLPRKEYSWSDRLGSIKKFMSNRPLPPVPPDTASTPPSQSPTHGKNDLSFIVRRVDEKPPQLPQRMQQRSSNKHQFEDDRREMDDEREIRGDEWGGEWNQTSDFNIQQKAHGMSHSHLNGKAHGDSPESRPRGRSLGGGNQSFREFDFSPPPPLSPGINQDDQRFNSLQKERYHHEMNQQNFHPPSMDLTSGMHMSTSATDLQNLGNPSYRGAQFHNFPVNPMALHYPHPYPMYPHYPNYPQYVGNSWVNLSSVHPPSTDGDLSDQSEASRASSKHPKSAPFGARAKRSQSAMFDSRMAYPPHMYPFGGYPPPPGYNGNPWNPADYPGEAPPSPSSSVRSFGRSGRSRRKKKSVASENNEEEGEEEENDDKMSVSSSPRNKPKFSSPSDHRPKKHKSFKRAERSSSLSSTSENEASIEPRRLSQKSMADSKKNKQHSDYARVEYRGRKHGPKFRSLTGDKPGIEDETRSPKFKKRGKIVASDDSSDPKRERDVERSRKNIVADERDVQVENTVMLSDGDREAHPMNEEQADTGETELRWECVHCTFANPDTERICQVCCKSKLETLSKTNDAIQDDPEASREAVDEDPDERMMEGVAVAQEGNQPVEKEATDTRNESPGTDMTTLNSALDEAEKELSRGLMELMKLKDGAAEYKSSVYSKRLASPELKPESPLKQDEMSLSRKSSQQSVNTESPRQPSTPYSMTAISKSVGTDADDLPESKQLGMKAKQEHSGGNLKLSQRKNSFGDEVTQPSSANNNDNSNNRIPRRDSSSQTQTEEKFSEPVETFPGSPFQYGERPEVQYPYGPADSVKSPKIAHPAYRGFGGGGQGVMHRSHSRASLFGGRLSDARPVALDCDNLGYGFGPSQMYRSLSRSSLTGDSSDPWMPEMRSLRRPDFYLSMEELVERRRQENMRAQGLELVRMIREAEELGFTADDIQVALSNCGKQNPVDWLHNNWKNMVNTVVTLSTNYGKDKRENDIGVLSENESRDALRLHKGNIWAAVTECVEGRQRKFLELSARGNFACREIVDALTKSEGNVEMAYAHLTTVTLKPFLMRIWGAGEGVENQDGDPSQVLTANASRLKSQPDHLGQGIDSDDNEYHSDQDIWDDDDDDVEEEVSWNEDEEDEAENPESFISFTENESYVQQLNRDNFVSNSITTPESDKSDYCDTFGAMAADGGYPMSSSPVDEIFFITGDLEIEDSKARKKGTSFLSHLAALRRNSKQPREEKPATDKNNKSAKKHECEFNPTGEKEASETQENPEGSGNKIYGAIDILKQTFSAIKDTVIGSSNKNDAKPAKSMIEARTIIVQNREGREILPFQTTAEECDASQSKDTLEANGRQSSLSSNLDYVKTDVSGSNVEDHLTLNAPEKVNLRKNDPTFSSDRPDPKTDSIVSTKKEDPSESDKVIGQMRNVHTRSPKSAAAIKTAMADKSASPSNVTSEKLEEQPILSQSGGKKPLTDNRDSGVIHQSLPVNTRKNDCLIQDEKPDINDGNTSINKKYFDPLETTNETPKLESPSKSDMNTTAQSSNTDNKLVEPAKDSSHNQLQDHDSKIASSAAVHNSRVDVQDEKDNEQSKGLKPRKVSKKDTTSPTKLVEQAEFREGQKSTMINERETETSAEKSKKDITSPTKLVEQPEFCEEQKSTIISERETETSTEKSKKSGVKPLKSKSQKSVHTSDQSAEVITITTNSLTRKSTTHEDEIKQLSLTPTQSEEREGESNSLKKTIFQKNTLTDNPLPVTVLESVKKSDEKVLPESEVSETTTENEFHDMMSRIKEKMENCLEVLNTSVSEDTQRLENGNLNLGNETQKITEDGQKKMDEVKAKSIPTDDKIPKTEASLLTTTEIGTSQSTLKDTVVDDNTKNLNIRQEENSETVKSPTEKEKLEKLSSTVKTETPDPSGQHILNISEKLTENPIKSVLAESCPSEKEVISIAQKPKTYKKGLSEAVTGEKVAKAIKTTKEEVYPEAVILEKGTVEAAPQQTTHNDMHSESDIGSQEAMQHVKQPEPNVAKKEVESSVEKNVKSKEVYPDKDNQEAIAVVRQQTSNPDSGISAQTSSALKEQISFQIANSDLEEPLAHTISAKRKDEASDSPVHSSRQREESNSLAELNKTANNPRQEEQLDANLNKETTSIIAEAVETVQPSSDHLNSQELPEVQEESKGITGTVTASKVADLDGKETETTQKDSAQSALVSSEVDGVLPNNSKPDAQTADSNFNASSIPHEDKVLINSTPHTNGHSSEEPKFQPGRERRISATVEVLKMSFEGLTEISQLGSMSAIRPQSPFGRMSSLNARREAIAQERNKESTKNVLLETKPWFIQKSRTPSKTNFSKKSIKQQLEFERKVRKLVSEKKCRTYRKAEIVVQLLELNFAENDAMQAANECSTLEQAISYLQQECLLCTGMYPVEQIVSMTHCQHKACKGCIKAYFTIQIRDRTIMELLCPFCNEPDIRDEDVAQDYFNHLDIMLKKLVDLEIHELFQRKLRDRVLMKDPNFRWCSQCSSGFIAMPNLKRLMCPDCNAVTCATCRRPWEREHDRMSCEEFAVWKDANDPEAQAAGLIKLLEEDGIDCPSCHFRYTLAKGGCMHFRCIQCQHDFCSGCTRPFKMGKKCGVSDFCSKLGLHAHHPRNCLFYLRDKDPEDLQKLLNMNDVQYDKDLPEGMEQHDNCQVMEQKETSEGMFDDICGKEVLDGYAGLCRLHYVEYLGQLVNKHKIDPIQIFCNDDLELVLKRASKRLPPKPYRESEAKYRQKLVQLIEDELPLDKMEGS